MNLYFKYLNRVIYYIFYTYYRCLYIASTLFQKKIDIVSPEKKYYNIIFEKFQNYIKNSDDDKNTNIDVIFYEKKEYNKIMKIENNNIESLWKTRILMDHNPRGNIIMFYDCYKMGFSYYCDQSVVPYEILNAVAMKYVMTYHCYSFFIDDLILPNDEKNPLKIHYLEEKKENTSSKPIVNNSFVKLKKMEFSTKRDESKTIMKNKFIHLGNIRNFKITQNVNKKNVKPFHSSLLDGLNNNVSYTEFKMLKEEKQKTH